MHPLAVTGCIDTVRGIRSYTLVMQGTLQWILARARSATDRERRPYERPRVLSRERLEAVAAICSPPGKADPGSCPTGPIGS